jgi:hypothetical protein
MSPPEVWGPPVWTFIHSLAENIRENKYNVLKQDLFSVIQRICNFLPCPECSQHAKLFLNKVNMNLITDKSQFKGLLHLFHNVVNKRKRKPAFNYMDLNKYKTINVLNAFNNFVRVYNTKGNMKLLMETFQRSLVVKDVRQWLLSNVNHFIFPKPPLLIEDQKPLIEEQTESLHIAN